MPPVYQPEGAGKTSCAAAAALLRIGENHREYAPCVFFGHSCAAPNQEENNEMEQTDAAQMDAARRGIVTEEMKKVAKKEGRDTTTSRQR